MLCQCKITAFPSRYFHYMSSSPIKDSVPKHIPVLPRFIFMTRWLQLPLYVGLILAQCVYVFHFWKELIDLLGAVLGNDAALNHILDLVTVAGQARPTSLNETTIMLVVLGLIDVVMISNLLIMVIIGGYETFVSRMHLDHHPDQPEWLSHVNASVLKVKLAMAIIGISSIHLLKMFMNIGSEHGHTNEQLMWGVIIHMTFVLSAVLMGVLDKMSFASHREH